MDDKLTRLKNRYIAGVMLNGFHRALKRFSLKGGACEEAGASIVDYSFTLSCIIHKKIRGKQTFDQTGFSCKPVNCAVNEPWSQQIA